MWLKVYNFPSLYLLSHFMGLLERGTDPTYTVQYKNNIIYLHLKQTLEPTMSLFKR
jgi:hypothetical protein